MQVTSFAGQVLNSKLAGYELRKPSPERPLKTVDPVFRVYAVYRTIAANTFCTKTGEGKGLYPSVLAKTHRSRDAPFDHQ